MSKKFFSSIDNISTLSILGMVTGNVEVNNLTSSNLNVPNASITNLSSSAITAGSIIIPGSLSVTNITRQNFLQTAGSVAFTGSNTIGNLFTTGGNVGIGTTSPRSKLTIDGLAGSYTSGPHLGIHVDNVQHPIYQQLNWSNDNISLNFDGYYNNTNWINSSTSTYYQIYKTGGQLFFRYASSGSAGSVASSFTDVMIISNTGRVSIPNGYVKSVVPSWSAYVAGGTSTANAVVTYNANHVTAQRCNLNAGAGTMTCTHPGRYIISFSAFSQNDSTEGTFFVMRKNTTQIARAYDESKIVNKHSPTMNLTIILDLVVGDYIDVYTGNVLHPNINCFFSGYMIG